MMNTQLLKIIAAASIAILVAASASAQEYEEWSFIGGFQIGFRLARWSVVIVDRSSSRVRVADERVRGTQIHREVLGPFVQCIVGGGHGELMRLARSPGEVQRHRRRRL